MLAEVVPNRPYFTCTGVPCHFHPAGQMPEEGLQACWLSLPETKGNGGHDKAEGRSDYILLLRKEKNIWA